MKNILFGVLLITFPYMVMADHDLTDDVTDEVKYEKSPRAQYTLGVMYLQGKGVKQDNKLALAMLSQASDQGYLLASHRLGRIYLSDEVTKADPTLAVKHITQAAQKGYSPSQYLLGTLYQTGEKGVTKNRKKALEWLTLAAGQGHGKAKQVLAKLTTEDSTIVDSGVAVASAEDVQSDVEKGMAYLKGKGVSRDYKQAALWLSKAAEQGNADAQFNLGELYNKGRGVKRSKKVAQKWYQAAASQGHIKAKYRTKNCAFC